MGLFKKYTSADANKTPTSADTPTTTGGTYVPTPIAGLTLKKDRSPVSTGVPTGIPTGPAPGYVTQPGKPAAPTVDKRGGRRKDSVGDNGTSTLKQTYHWVKGVSKSSVDDMVLLSNTNNAAITENLKKRFMEDKIYTYIGPVLVAVNPFKQLPYYSEKEIILYQGAAHYEVPPHIYALADSMYRNMLSDNDSQCVIISGESGAGKTVSAKFIMDYITRVSGGGPRVQHVKDIILNSNPLLEAFGNAKTIRNNNSSRFGKYIEIDFSLGGEPQGGQISNFLLEKSRVHFLNGDERNFHIFYQLCDGADDYMREQLGVYQPSDYSYLAQSGSFKVDGTNDAKDFQETIEAMRVMGIDEGTQMDIFRMVAAILHMGNIPFVEVGNYGQVADPAFLEFPAYLLGVSTSDINQKLTSRVMESRWGSSSEKIDITHNLEQVQFARDAWTKGIYSRLFDHIVETVNKAMVTDKKALTLGILDIYGFEIFEKNGFEQFCINYVNEKLQQIFIELTLKNEQEEYQSEGIKWKPIKFFNNKVVCDMIESKSPPGIFSILDDTCATMSAVTEGADEDFRNKSNAQITSQGQFALHYQNFREGFTIRHYAGEVSYHTEGFCEKNRDVLFADIIEVMKGSTNAFVRRLFAGDVTVTPKGSKGRPTTVGTKIRSQAQTLMSALALCVPNYIRCIKPNETKRPRDWNETRVKHQVEYLGLKENVEVKRAGFAYRRPFHKFLQRYAILSKETWPRRRGDERQSINVIMSEVAIAPGDYQLGRTKVFIKEPESLYMLEECRERKFDYHARIIQKAFRKYFKGRHYHNEKQEASNMVLGFKERRDNSLNRNFYKDYVGVESKGGLMKLLPKREKVEFAETVNKYDRRFKCLKRELILTNSALFLIGRERIKKGPNKGKVEEVVKRKIAIYTIEKVTLSPYQDNFVLISVRDDFESLLEVNFKTEFLMALNKKVKQATGRELNRNFNHDVEYRVKKIRFLGSGTRQVRFTVAPIHEISSSGSVLNVKVPRGLPPNTRPSLKRVITQDVRDLYYSGISNNNNYKGASPLPKYNQKHIQPSAFNQPQISPNQHRFGGNSPYRNGQLANQNPWPTNVPPPPQEPAPINQPVLRKVPPPISRPPLKPKPHMNLVRVIYQYDAQDADELTLLEGETVELIKKDDSGWWTCKKNGKEGFCPGNYVEEI